MKHIYFICVAVLVALASVSAESNAAVSAAQNFESMPAWSSSYDASWGRSAAWSIVSDGQSGPGLSGSRIGGGSSSKVMIYNLAAGTEYSISVFMRCPSWSSTYWAEFAYRLGSHSAQDFDSNAAAWSLIKKFSTATANGNGNTWIRYALSFNSGSQTRISV
ncbi:MAG: hypothetical protein ACYSW0_26100, partial [Planctomycetota bacterium]